MNAKIKFIIIYAFINLILYILLSYQSFYIFHLKNIELTNKILFLQYFKNIFFLFIINAAFWLFVKYKKIKLNLK